MASAYLCSVLPSELLNWFSYVRTRFAWYR